MGVGWASGINLYAAVLVLGLGADRKHPVAGNVAVHPESSRDRGGRLDVFCRVFADKTPGWIPGGDAIHTFIRIPRAMLAASAVGM